MRMHNQALTGVLSLRLVLVAVVFLGVFFVVNLDCVDLVGAIILLSFSVYLD